MINSQWLELAISGINLHGPKVARAIEDFFFCNWRQKELKCKKDTENNTNIAHYVFTLT